VERKFNLLRGQVIMPNWCNNKMYITGEEEKAKEVMDFIGNDFDFKKIVPYPEKFKQMDEEYSRLTDCHRHVMSEEDKQNYLAKWGTEWNGFNCGGYDWCCDNWGTKWNVNENMDIYDPDGVIEFQTAWSPPEPIIVKLSEMFPEVEIKLVYEEPGVGFIGKLVCKNGKRLKDTTVNVSCEPEDVVNLIQKMRDEYFCLLVWATDGNENKLKEYEEYHSKYFGEVEVIVAEN
jgi:hypothetical protein